jgi:hypothetical protein
VLIVEIKIWNADDFPIRYFCKRRSGGDEFSRWPQSRASGRGNRGIRHNGCYRSPLGSGPSYLIGFYFRYTLLPLKEHSSPLRRQFKVDRLLVFGFIALQILGMYLLVHAISTVRGVRSTHFNRRRGTCRGPRSLLLALHSAPNVRILEFSLLCKAHQPVPRRS